MIKYTAFTVGIGVAEEYSLKALKFEVARVRIPNGRKDFSMKNERGSNRAQDGSSVKNRKKPKIRQKKPKRCQKKPK